MKLHFSKKVKGKASKIYTHMGASERECLISYEKVFKMLENYIAGIGHAILKLLSFKVGQGITEEESPYFRNFQKSSVI